MDMCVRDNVRSTEYLSVMSVLDSVCDGIGDRMKIGCATTLCVAYCP